MSERLGWDPSVPSLMLLNERGGGHEVACVRRRGAEFDFVTYVGGTKISERRFTDEVEARREAEAQTRELFKKAGG